MCYNAVDVNARTKVSKRHIPDCMSVVDELSKANYMSLVDLKGAFFNHLVAKNARKYLGFITQDGMYRFVRMPFGCVNAPAVLQSSLEFIIHEDGHVYTVIYYDDITSHGESEAEVWESTLKTIKKLAKYGYMINLNKCHFLVESAKLLGFQVWDGGYQLGPKAVKKLFGTGIPNSVKGV